MNLVQPIIRELAKLQKMKLYLKLQSTRSDILFISEISTGLRMIDI